jgi:hypothetical protein
MVFIFIWSNLEMIKYINVPSYKSIKDIYKFEYVTDDELILELLLNNEEILPGFSNFNLARLIHTERSRFAVVVFHQRILQLVNSLPNKKAYTKYQYVFIALSLLSQYFTKQIKPKRVEEIFNSIISISDNQLLIKAKINKIKDTLIGYSNGSMRIPTIKKVSKSLLMLMELGVNLGIEDQIILSGVVVNWILISVKKVINKIE